jgi:hypothetical protein
MKVLNELRVQISTKHLKAEPFLQIEVQAKDVFFFNLDDIELVDWTSTDKFARFWYCQDIHHSSILKLAIEKAMNKSSDHLLSRNLFDDESNDQQNQFVGFVSSHTKGV